MFFRQSGYTWLVVGLGNPGARYESTRHNMGFLALDRLAEREKLRFNKLRFKAWTAEWKLGEDKVLVMKPQTYMNLSVSDDIALPVGKLRLRAAGSAGGHNGLKNIIRHLGSDRFPRIKVGVGMPQNAEYDIADWVTGMPMGEEQKILLDALDRAAQAIPAVITLGMDKAMNRFN